MRIIGLTGGVGCGKSTVTDILKEKYGAFVIQTDAVGHLALEKGCKTYQQILLLFGEEILDAAGKIDRKRLGDKVFSNPEKLSALNDIVHPFVRKTVEELLRKAEKEKASFVVLESAILIESGYTGLCDEIWMVTAEKEVRFQRLSASRGYTREKLEDIMQRQLPEEAMRAKADRLIWNNGSREELEEQLREIFTGRLKDVML